MSDRSLAAVDAVTRIRAAQCDSARAAVLLAQQDLGRVSQAEESRRTDRDAAEQGWQSRLQGRRPDPALLGLAARWLIEREHGLDAARLDTAIALKEKEAAEDVLGQALARLEATREIQAQLKRAQAQRREARDLAQAADQFLQRRGQ